MKICGSWLVSLAALSTLVADGLEGQTRTITGTVRDRESSEVIPRAIVSVKGLPRTTSSNVDGRFTFLGAPTDTVYLLIRALGFTPTELMIEPGPGETRIEVRMRASPITLDEVTVTAEVDRMVKATEAVSVLEISPAVVSQLPNVGERDLFRSIQLMPGVSGTNESSAGLYVRGGTPDQNLVLLDGMTVYHVDHFYGFFSAFNADAIKDVKVWKGGFPAGYGGRVSSVVELTGKTGDVDKSRYGMGLSFLSGTAFLQVPLRGKGAILVTGRRSYTDLIKTPLYKSIFNSLSGGGETVPQNPGGPFGGGGPFGNAATTTASPDFYFYDLNAKVTYNLSPRDVVSLSGYAGHDNLDNSRDLSRTVGVGNLTGSLDELTDWGNRGVSAKWSRQWTPRLYSNALLATSRYSSNYDRRMNTSVSDSGTGPRGLNIASREANRIGDRSLRLDVEWQAARAHSVSFGTWLTGSDASFSFLRDDTTSILDLDQRANQQAFYLQDVWRPWAGLELNLGLRHTSVSTFTEGNLEPRATATLSVTSKFRLKAAYGQYHQYVSRVVNENIGSGSRDFWLLAGDEIPVSGATHYVAGASYETSAFLFDVELYRKRLTGLSEFSLRFRPAPGSVGPQASIDNLFYSGSGVSEGAELLVQKKTGLHTGWLSYTLGRVRHTFPGLNGGLAFPALNDQTHELKLVNLVSVKKWNFGATWALGTGKPYTSPESQYVLTLLDGRQESYIHVGEKNGERLPPYHRLDISATHVFKTKKGATGEFGISVFNLYNRKNVWYREFDLTESPYLVTDVRYLGLTPTLSLRLFY
jgi:ferric enterobactin receptor